MQYKRYTYRILLPPSWEADSASWKDDPCPYVFIATVVLRRNIVIDYSQTKTHNEQEIVIKVN
jgi:hypothetical protein